MMNEENLIPQLASFDNGSFSRGSSMIKEAIWLVVEAIFISSWIPGSLHRRLLLRLFGSQIGRGVVIKSGVHIKFPWRLSVGDRSWIGERVWIDNLAPVTIGSNVCISQGAYLCTGSHDWSRQSFDLRSAPITINEGAWIAAMVVIGPGVKVGSCAVATLGSVVSHSIEDRHIYNSGLGTHQPRFRSILPSKY